MVSDSLTNSLVDAVAVIEQLRSPESVAFIKKTAELLAERLGSGNKILLAGNGGSLCDASHFAEELTGYFRKDRPALSAICLNDPGHLTCVANDVGFDHVFARGVEAFGKVGDVFVGLTTSGNSQNLVKAFSTAKRRGLYTVSFLGKGGGHLLGVADQELVIADMQTSDRIQEAHMTAVHLIIEQLEYKLFPLHCQEEEKTASIRL